MSHRCGSPAGTQCSTTRVGKQTRNAGGAFRWLLVMAALLVVCSPRAYGHAVLVRSNPADGAILHTGTVTFTLDYNSRIDERRSVMHLTGPDNHAIAVAPEKPTGPAQLKAAVHGLKNGIYHLAWQVLAQDGHITRGAVTFTVALP
jgi:methionine-rich copper-binding protein CopC